MTITAADVNKLRQQTGAGMMDCKKALTESNGDFEAAIDFLRKKGQKVSANRAERDAKEGVIIAKTNDNKTKGIILELNCETDFVAKNDAFVAFATSIADAAMASSAKSAEEVMNLSISGAKVSDLITEQVGKIGEKIEISSYVVEESENVIAYTHAGAKLGVLVALNKSGNGKIEDAGKDIAMQIAAMNPIALDKDEVDSTTMMRELEIAKEQIRAEGKPEDMVEKIAQGKMNKFFKDSTLLNQQFVKDSSKTIRQMVEETDKELAVKAFRRIELGAN